MLTHVIADGSRKKNHGDAEGWIFFLSFPHLAESGKSFEAADNEKSVEFPQRKAVAT